MQQFCALDEFLAIVVGQKPVIDRQKDQNGLGDVRKQANNCQFCHHFAYQFTFHKISVVITYEVQRNSSYNQTWYYNKLVFYLR